MIIVLQWRNCNLFKKNMVLMKINDHVQIGMLLSKVVLYLSLLVLSFLMDHVKIVGEVTR